MQSAPKVIGRVHAQYGKSLVDIVTGKYLVSTKSLQNTEPSLMKVCEIYSDPNYRGPDRSQARRLVVESWSRGVYEGRKNVVADIRKCDWQVLTAEQEQAYLQRVKTFVDNPPPTRVLPATVGLPPLLRLHLQQQYGSAPDRLPRRPPTDAYTRLAAPGETPNVPTSEVDGLGTPTAAHLYEGVDLTAATHPPSPEAIPLPLPFRTCYPIKHKMQGEKEETDDD